MTFLAAILTCPQRSEALALTLSSLKSTDWPADPLIVCDQHNLRNKEASQTANALRLLREAKALDWDYLLFLEDDVVFNKYLHHNLVNWYPVATGQCKLGRLYSPDKSNVQSSKPEANYFTRLASEFYTTQAMLLHRSTLALIIDKWADGWTGEMHDIRISRIISRVDPYCYCHSPCLVQHQPVASTWGGGRHDTDTFDPDFKA